MGDGLEPRVDLLSHRVDALENRVRNLEQQDAATQVWVKTLQEGIGDAKKAADRAAVAVDQLKMWALVTLAAMALNLLYMMLKGLNP